MKKLLLFLLMFILLGSEVIASNKQGKVFNCSYICGGTDIYFKLEPFIINNNGSITMNNKIIGKVIEAKDGEIFAQMGGGSTWSLETKRMLSIYTKPIDNELIYNFGSCVAK